jgi:hypothetical protein
VLSKPVPLLPPPPSAPSSSTRVQTACDLISLAEKGKVGGASSSSAASSSSSSSSAASSTSGDEDQQQLHQKALRHRETNRAVVPVPAGYRKLVKPTDEEAPPLSPTSAYQDSIPDPEVCSFNIINFGCQQILSKSQSINKGEIMAVLFLLTSG